MFEDYIFRLKGLIISKILKQKFEAKLDFKKEKIEILIF